MNKTITRDFWINKSLLCAIKSIKPDMGYRFDYFVLSDVGTRRHGDVKITISWEPPERNVTISESEFDDLFSGLNTTTFTSSYIKEKLFNKQD